MDNVKDDAYYVKKILKDAKYLMEKSVGLTLEQLEDDETLCDSVLFRLIQISENTKKLTEDFKAKNKVIPWRAIIGMRNRIVHEYGDVEFDVVYDTLVQDVPELCKLLEELF